MIEVSSPELQTRLDDAWRRLRKCKEARNEKALSVPIMDRLCVEALEQFVSHLEGETYNWLAYKERMAKQTK